MRPITREQTGGIDVSIVGKAALVFARIAAGGVLGVLAGIVAAVVLWSVGATSGAGALGWSALVTAAGAACGAWLGHTSAARHAHRLVLLDSGLVELVVRRAVERAGDPDPKAVVHAAIEAVLARVPKALHRIAHWVARGLEDRLAPVLVAADPVAQATRVVGDHIGGMHRTADVVAIVGFVAVCVIAAVVG